MVDECRATFDRWFAAHKGDHAMYGPISFGFQAWQAAWNARSAGTPDDVREYIRAMANNEHIPGGVVTRAKELYAAMTANGDAADRKAVGTCNAAQSSPPSPASAVGDGKLSTEQKRIILNAMRDSCDKTSNEIVEKVAIILNPPESDWHPHHGGECPVSGDTRCDAKIQNGGYWNRLASEINWSHVTDYRIVKPGGEV